MKSPNELSFLPDDYLERKAQRRTNAICATLFMVVMVAIGSAFTYTERSMRAVERDHVSIEKQFTDAAKRIQELFLAGHKDEAIATVPDEWVDLKSLVGPPARIRERYRAWEDSGADSLSVRSRQPEAIEVMAKAARLN